MLRLWLILERTGTGGVVVQFLDSSEMLLTGFL